MTIETVEVLREIFSDTRNLPPEEETEWNVNAFRDIGADLLLATCPQTRRHSRSTRLDTSRNSLLQAPELGAAEGKTMATAKSPRVKINGLGKCAYIDSLYVQGGHTKSQILALVLKSFPDSDEKSTRNTVNLRPGYVTKAGKTPKWEQEVPAAK